MVRQVQVLSSTLLMISLFTSCSPQQEVNDNKQDYSQIIFNAEDIAFKQNQGIVYVDGDEFNGSLYWLYPNSLDTLKVRSYSKGLKNGEWRKYYPTGVLKEKRYFKMGKKEGEHIGYFMNGDTQFIYHLKNDVYEGNSKAWTQNGTLIRDQNYKNGFEEGAQKVWYDNGKIKANYIKKNGRRYGLLGTKNCVNVYDETI